MLIELLEELSQAKAGEIVALEKYRNTLKELNADKEAYVELLKYCINLCEELRYTNRALYTRIFNKLQIITDTREKALINESN